MRDTLLLASHDVASLLDLDSCISVVETAFRLHGEGRAAPPGILGMHAHAGGFHIKAGMLDVGRRYFAAKINANFPENRSMHGLPTIQGVITLSDGDNGRTLAVLDSSHITILRTGAATAVAARALARSDAAVLTICGCGNQGRVQLAAISRVRPLRHAFAFDADAGRAAEYAREAGATYPFSITVARDLAAAARQSDIVVTCTPSRGPLLRPGDVKPGTFIAAVGADSPEKQELDPRLVADGAVIGDVIEQCATIGELHHAIDAELVTRDRVRGELGEVLIGRKPGRMSDGEIVIFDSTGMALQDVAAAVAVYERATSQGAGIPFNFAA